MPGLTIWSYFFQCGSSVVMNHRYTVYLKCHWGLSLLILSFSGKHALGVSATDSMMLSNWQFKICTCYACVRNPQAIFMSLVSHKQAKDIEVLQFQQPVGFFWYTLVFTHTTCSKISLVITLKRYLCQLMSEVIVFIFLKTVCYSVNVS